MATLRAAALLLLIAGLGQAAAVTGSIPLGLDLYMPVPEDNPLTAEKIELGRRLFSDRRLSRDGSIACSSCHEPERAFSDGRSIPVGVSGRQGRRSAPALINRGYGRAFFWDGRSPSLEEQVLKPIQDPNEMDLTLDEAVSRLAHMREYADQFETAFGRAVNAQDLARALASYVRTITSGDAPLDRYMNGDRDALSAQERAGLAIFRGKGNCTACHVGPTLSDEQFHNTGVAWKNGELHDLGRFAVTRNDADRGAFKTPTLREIARTAPYMHNGTFSTLEEVVDFYNRGGNTNPLLDSELRPLDLSVEEKRALLTFLRSLDGHISEGPDAVVDVK